ncbi:CBS domain-containing protein [Pluralibacter sp.]|uniref:CBS domain-containing protein n=1 Tax=Pluralibacter sp. TaxID=1920032 RepID=UPI0025EA1752|nr:CBS domain-containing protein [Pluralibacter sp.]MBV8041534.1 CBS domain-containing protein [Pluralibacter sp.]
MIAADVMTTAPVTVNEDTPILEVVSLLLNLQISGLPVLDGNGKMTGIVTEGDLLRRSELGTEIKRPHWKELFLSPGKLARDYVQSHARYAGEVMTPSPLTVGPEMPLDEVISLMETYGIKRMPVVDDAQLVGIITRVDILKALRTLLIHNRSPGNAVANKINDETMKQKIIDAMERESWAPKNNLRITVTHGVVDIYGTILDEDLRAAIITLVEEVTETRDIRDHLVFIEPITGLYITPQGSPEQ